MRRLTILMISMLAAFGVMAHEPDPLPPQALEAGDSIDGSLLRAHVRFLSDDLLGGRGPATEGDALTQLYLSTEMEKLGLEPAGIDGTWTQPFDIVGVDTKVPATWTFSRGGQTVRLDRGEEFVAVSGQQKKQSSLNNSELVFVGYGIEAPEYGWDDFKGMDLKGKTLVFMNNDPDWAPNLFEGDRRLYYGRWTYKYESAARQGAAGAIVIHTTPTAGYPWQVVQTSWTGEQFGLPAGPEPRLSVEAWVSEDAARELMKLAGKDLDQLVESARRKDFRPVPLGIRTSLDLAVEISAVTTANVAGILRGSDSILRDEVVIYTAHHDHLGTAEEGEGDRIYNGALDNGSGTSQVLAIAKAFTELPARPARSVMFLFVAAEEQGLLGSRYWADHPTIEPGKIAANINIDGANIWGRTEDLTFIGYGKSSLDSIVERFAAMQGRSVQGDQFPDRGFFYRSDQFHFARIGVPAIYTDTGTKFRGRPAGWGKQQIENWEATNYHQVNDELEDSWNFEGMVEDARLLFLTGLVVAESEEMPSWNPGDEFEAARKEALANRTD
ncbi:MAG: M28 family peptidase [Acidobacteria bacterium]|nr:M28 family peptidase [Acidobacteriota bacterium]